MKLIPELSKGDMLNVNGEIYQLISHKTLEGGENGEMALEIGRLGDRNPSTVLRLIYKSENPLSLRLEALDKNTGSWKEQKLMKFGF